jgi:DNA-binding Lrp family transcriptional regulator
MITSHCSLRRETLKDVELRLVSELLKNNRRSDRDIAKAMGVSQPTVSRLIKKLEKEGIIKEHTIIPDFRKLGIELAAFVFCSWFPEKIKEYSYEKRRNKATEFFSKHPNVVFASSGQGLNKNSMMMSLHKDYADYSEFIKETRAEYAGLVDLESFIISLKTDQTALPFSLRNLGKYLEKIV